MAIKFNCPHCQRALNVKDHLAGKRAACPSCKKVLVIPSPAAASTVAPAPVPSAAHLEEEAVNALRDTVSAETPAAATVDFTCPQCDEQVSLALDLAGKQAPCPKCRRIIKVPQPEKKDPADWRKTDRLPTGARRDVGPAPEGAWTAERKAASLEALEEAGAIPQDRRKGLTRKQKITRASLAGAAVVLLLVGGLVAYGYSKRGAQDRLVTQAVQLAEASGTPEAAAEVYRAAGEYALRSGSRDAAAEAQERFRHARELLVKARPGAERDLGLIDLALSQIDLGGAGPDVDAGKRLKWDQVHNEVRQTLAQVTSSGGRLLAVREVARKLLAKNQGAAVAGLARLYLSPAKGGEGEERLAYEGPEALAVAGLEMLQAGQKDLAGRLLGQALEPYAAKDAKQRLPLAPSVVALAVLLGQPEPRPGPSNEDAELLVIGRAEALARQGDAAKARASLPAKALAETRLRALAAIAGAADSADPDTLDAALALLDGELKGRPGSPWTIYRLALAAVKAGSVERAARLSEAVADPALKGRVRVEVLRQQLAAKPERADITQADVTEGPPAVKGLARELWARHNAALDGGTAAQAAAWDEAARPFGLVGAALGLQDRQH